MDDFGSRLRKLRGNRSRKRISRELGITEGALQAYESGKRQPRDEVRLRVALYYGVPVRFLEVERKEASFYTQRVHN